MVYYLKVCSNLSLFKGLYVSVILMTFDITSLYKIRNSVSEIQRRLQCECNVHSGFENIVTIVTYYDMWEILNIGSLCDWLI